MIPASGPVIILSSPSMRLTRVDLPALGRPTIASLRIAPEPPSSSASSSSFSRSTCGSRAWNRSAMPSPCSALSATGSPSPRRQASSVPLSPAPPSALLATTITGVEFRAQPTADFLVEGGQAFTRIDHE